MATWETARHQVAIAGRVTDALTGEGLGGAAVTVDPPGACGAVMTRADGHYHLLDLPDGTYAVSATLPAAGSRYGTLRVSAAVSRGPDGRLRMAAADLALPSTAIRGKIVRHGGGRQALAEVRIRGSGERAFSDGDGRYLLAGIEAGLRTIVVSAQGFRPVERTVRIDRPGDAVTVNVTLAPV